MRSRALIERRPIELMIDAAYEHNLDRRPFKRSGTARPPRIPPTISTGCIARPLLARPPYPHISCLNPGASGHLILKRKGQALSQEPALIIWHYRPSLTLAARMAAFESRGLSGR